MLLVDKCELDCLVEELADLNAIYTSDRTEIMEQRENDLETLLLETDNWDALKNAWAKGATRRRVEE